MDKVVEFKVESKVFEKVLEIKFDVFVVFVKVDFKEIVVVWFLIVMVCVGFLGVSRVGGLSVVNNVE